MDEELELLATCEVEANEGVAEGVADVGNISEVGVTDAWNIAAASGAANEVPSPRGSLHSGSEVIIEDGKPRPVADCIINILATELAPPKHPDAVSTRAPSRTNRELAVARQPQGI